MKTTVKLGGVGMWGTVDGMRWIVFWAQVFMSALTLVFCVAMLIKNHNQVSLGSYLPVITGIVGYFMPNVRLSAPNAGKGMDQQQQQQIAKPQQQKHFGRQQGQQQGSQAVPSVAAASASASAAGAGTGATAGAATGAPAQQAGGASQPHAGVGEPQLPLLPPMQQHQPAGAGPSQQQLDSTGLLDDLQDERMVFSRFMVQFAVGIAVMVFAMAALATHGFNVCYHPTPPRPGPSPSPSPMPSPSPSPSPIPSPSPSPPSPPPNGMEYQVQCTVNGGLRLNDAVLEGLFLPIITAINAYFMPTPGRTSSR
jgi:hypothetical protein